MSRQDALEDSIEAKFLTNIRQEQNLSEYRKVHWEGSFAEYLDIVRDHPEVTRSAYQRLYDMIMSHGIEEVLENKDKVIRYKFFTQFAARQGDAIFGLDDLMPGPAQTNGQEPARVGVIIDNK